MSIFSGAGVAIVTPFSENGINYKVFDKMLDFHLNNSTDAIFVCGTTGEPSTMTDAERFELIEYTVNYVNKRIPVIAGTGCNNTQKSINDTKKAMALGVDGALVVSPYYNKATQAGLIQHYNAIADVGLPVFVYNVPSRTNLNILPTTLAKIAEHKNIVAVKEAHSDLSQALDIYRLCGDKLDMYCANDDIIVPMLAAGAKGVISVVGNILPQETHDIVALFNQGKTTEALALQLKLNPIIKTLFSEVNPIPVKAALNLLGFDAGNPRLPLTPMEQDHETILISQMKELSLI